MVERGEGKQKETGTSLLQRSQKLTATEYDLVLSLTVHFHSLDTSHGNVLKNIQENKELLLPLQQASNAEGEIEVRC